MDQGSGELRAIYLAYRSVLAACPSGTAGGRLLLLNEEVEARLSRSRGARIAGAATLVVIESLSAAKDALRTGAVDFMVSSLDEALRILKNELRRKAAVSVCLHAGRTATLAACAVRGVQADLIDGPGEWQTSRGVEPVSWQKELGPGEGLASWRVEELSTLTVLDRLVEDCLRGEDGIRRRWLRHAPANLGRRWQKERVLPLQAEEWERFVSGAGRLPGVALKRFS